MLSTNQLGNLGESKAITRFIEEGFDIFTQFSGHKPLDVDNVDILVVYIQPIDTLCFFHTGDLDNKCSITLRETRTALNQKIISDYKDIGI